MTNRFGLKVGSGARNIAVAVIVLLIPLGAAVAQLAPSQRRAPTASAVLVNSVFAAGTGGSPMTSTFYCMLGVLGETGLANKMTADCATAARRLIGR